MIKIYYVDQYGREDYIIFYDVKKALRFLYGTMKKYIISGWVCDRDEDNDYLNYRFRPELKR